MLSGPFWCYLSRYQVVKASLRASVISVRKIIAPCVPRKHVPFGERITAVGLSAVRRLVVFRAPSGRLQSAVWLSSERRLTVVRAPSGLSSERRLAVVRAPSGCRQSAVWLVVRVPTADGESAVCRRCVRRLTVNRPRVLVFGRLFAPNGGVIYDQSLCR